MDNGHIGPSPGASLEAELREWWRRTAEAEVEQVVPKAVEYSSYDLDLIGRVMADMLGMTVDSEAERVELGCFWYLLGKVGRMAGAYRDGRLPSDDTLHDTGVYVRMMQRARVAGGWPGKVSTDA